MTVREDRSAPGTMTSSSSCPPHPAEATNTTERPRIFDRPVLVGLAIYGLCLTLVLVLYHFQ